MLKKVLIAVALLASQAVSAFAVTEVEDTINESITHESVTVSSYVATTAANQLSSASLSGATTGFFSLLENRKEIAIQNLDTSANLWCRIGLSSTSANGDLSIAPPTGLATTQGKKIAPGATWNVSIKARNHAGRVFIPFCANDSGTATSKVEFIQVRSK